MVWSAFLERVRAWYQVRTAEGYLVGSDHDPSGATPDTSYGLADSTAVTPSGNDTATGGAADGDGGGGAGA